MASIYTIALPPPPVKQLNTIILAASCCFQKTWNSSLIFPLAEWQHCLVRIFLKAYEPGLRQVLALRPG